MRHGGIDGLLLLFGLPLVLWSMAALFWIMVRFVRA